MQKTHFWHLFYIYGNKITLLCFVLLGFVGQKAAIAQSGSFNYDNKFSKKNYYFGITLGLKNSRYRVESDISMVHNSQIRFIQSRFEPGLNIGIVTNIKIKENFDFRFLLPTLSLANRLVLYTNTRGDQVQKTVESVFLEFPLHFRYKSKPYKDIRLFVVGGMKYSIDLISNSNRRKAEDLLKVHANDLVGEFGLGFQFFFPYFILSPEVKFSYGLFDLHAPDTKLVYSNVIDKLYSRGITVSLHFEG